MKAKPILAIFITMLLMAVAVPFIASADTTQTWYLNDSTSTAGRVMDKGSPDTEESSVSITDNSSVVWIADQAASTDVGFPSGFWMGPLYFTSAPDSGTDTITVDIGSSDNSEAGNFTSNGTTQTFDPDGSTTLFFINLSASQFTVSNGDYLALKITNATGSSVSVDTGGGSQSSVASPSSDPGYPIPELPTIVLLATGLVGLAGYFVLKRRKRDYLRA